MRGFRICEGICAIQPQEDRLRHVHNIHEERPAEACLLPHRDRFHDPLQKFDRPHSHQATSST